MSVILFVSPGVKYINPMNSQGYLNRCQHQTKKNNNNNMMMVTCGFPSQRVNSNIVILGSDIVCLEGCLAGIMSV